MKIKDVLKSFGYIILYVVIMIIFGVINEIFFKDNSMLQWISIFENILILLCFLSIFKFKLKTIKSFKKEYIKYIAKYWVIGLVLLLITNYIVIYINGGIAPSLRNTYWYRIRFNACYFFAFRSIGITIYNSLLHARFCTRYDL